MTEAPGWWRRKQAAVREAFSQGGAGAGISSDLIGWNGSGSYLTSILVPLRRIDQALYGLVIEAYVAGVLQAQGRCPDGSPRRAGRDLKSQVSRIYTDIDLEVQAFISRPLEARGYSYLYLDATYLHGRLSRVMQVCSRCCV